MHPLLRRQLSKWLPRPLQSPDKLDALLNAIDQAYCQFDEERNLLERSIEISSDELRRQNQALEQRLTELQSTRDKLERSYSLLRSTLDSTADAIVVVAFDKTIRAHNRQFADLWGIDLKTDILGKRADLLFRGFLKQIRNRSAVIAGLRQLRTLQTRKIQVLIELRDGRALELHVSSQLQGGLVVGRVFSCHDVTAKRADEETIRQQAYHDSLTGLPNRLLMNDRLKHAVQLAKRSGSRLCLLFLDLDHFKAVNDRLGHEAGDRLLVEVTQRLKKQLRDCDTICRLGGDEFTVILENLANPSDWQLVTEKLNNALVEPFDLSGQEAWISTSIGVSRYPEDAANAEELIRHADMAMYEAKKLGRNRCAEFNLNLQRETDRRAHIELELRHAIERNELYLVYQPKHRLQDMELVGFEALLRWSNKTLGSVGPDEFIPVAEQSGLILSIGEWVLRDACAQLRRWHLAGHADISLAVNMSVEQFQQPDLFSLVEDTLSISGLAPDYLELEVTESSVMVDVPQVTRNMEDLRKIGVLLAIDDFGAGYTSMSYLKKLPVNYLKIDRTLVSDLAFAADDLAIVTSIITLAHNLGLEVIAEGVEDATSLELLRRHGCDQAQGFFMNRPLSLDNAALLLDSFRPAARLAMRY